jgi:ubiquinone/menaquinone biosynthesis C-methylase UbiE
MTPKEATERLDTRTAADRLQIALHNQRYDFVLEHLTGLESVLEIGTGTGNLSATLACRCGKYIGVEFDQATCSIAAQRIGVQGQIIQADARNLPFERSSFSGIVCLEVLEHLGDFVLGIKNIHRCLRPDGMVIISVPFRRRGGASPTNPFHLYEPGEKELLNILRRYFKKVRIFYQYFEESRIMKLARSLHLRKLLGFESLYRSLSQGEPEAIGRLKINAFSHGMKMHLVVIAEEPKAL